MSEIPNQVVAFPSSRAESFHRCAQHMRVWLAATGRVYDNAAREDFVRAHPELFGRAYEVTLRGYECWRGRHAILDTVEGFSRYMLRRHERWIAAIGATSALAPCLIGTATTRPCWSAADADSSAQNQFGAAA
jgi:hypothetical protein